MLLNKIFKLPGMWGVYLNSWFRGIGSSLVNFFIPIYIYGFRQSLADVLLFFFIYHLAVVISGFFSTQIISRIGIDWSEFVGAVLRVAALLFLNLMTQNWLFFYLSAFVWGLMINFCWIPFHYTVIALDDGDKKYGKEASFVAIVDKLTLVLGPILAGLIIKSSGYFWLFTIAGIFVFFSGITFFLDKFVRSGMDFSTKRIIKDLLGKKRRRIWLSLSGYSLETFIASIFWPLFIFLNLNSITKTGLAQGLSLLVAMLLIFLVGKRVDTKGYGVAKAGLIILSFNWLLRIFISSGATIFTSNIFSQFGGILLWLPFSAWVYSRISQERKTEFLLEREIVIHATGAILCLGLLAFIEYFSWYLVFALAILGLFMTTGGVWSERRKR